MATFWERLLIQLTICSLCIMSICYFVFSHFGFEGGTVVLIVPVPVHYLPKAFSKLSDSFRLSFNEMILNLHHKHMP